MLEEDDELTRLNPRLITSVNDPVYTIPYLTAQARNGLVHISSMSLTLPDDGNIICEIKNNSSNKMTSVEGLVVSSSVNIGYSIIRNGIVNGSLMPQTVYNVNNKHIPSTTTLVAAAADTMVSISDGDVLLRQLSLANHFNPISIVPLIINPRSSLYFWATGESGLSVTINVIFTEYPGNL